MKTFFKDFTPSEIPLIEKNSDLYELIDARHEKFRATTEYLKAIEEVNGYLKKLESLLPEEHRSLGKLENAIFWLGQLSYGAGYSDGIADLMTAMTFNKLGLTMAKYIDISSKTA